MILIVDDDDSVREMLRRVLEGEGYRILTAATGAQAREIAAAVALDLVLLDLNLPDESGWDTFEVLSRARPLLPVVVVTARSRQLAKARGAGVAALLEKPLDFPRLLQTVADLLGETAESRLARLSGKSPPPS
jgi:DNA-binding response OmpR family regulator